jgi:hypothetical protein
MWNKIPQISNEEVISAFSTGAADIKMKDKLSMNDELTSVVRLFEITDRCAKAKEGRLFMHSIPEAAPPKSKPMDPKRKEAAILAAGPEQKHYRETTPSVTRADDTDTASSTSATPTIPMIIWLSGSFMKRMV